MYVRNHHRDECDERSHPEKVAQRRRVQHRTVAPKNVHFLKFRVHQRDDNASRFFPAVSVLQMRLFPSISNLCGDARAPNATERAMKRKSEEEEEEEEEGDEGGRFTNASCETACAKLDRLFRRRRSLITVSGSVSDDEEEEEETPFETFKATWRDTRFDEVAFADCREKSACASEHAQRLFDTAFALLDKDDDDDVEEEEDVFARTAGAVFLLYALYVRQPKKWDDRDEKEDGALERTRVYASVKRIETLCALMRTCNEAMLSSWSKKKKEKTKTKTKEGKKEGEEETRRLPRKVTCASEVLACLNELFSDGAFVVGVSHPLTEQRRNEIVEARTKKKRTALLDAFSEVRENVARECGGMRGVAALVEQTKKYGSALEKSAFGKAGCGPYPARQIGEAVERYMKRLETKIDAIFKDKPLRMRRKRQVDCKDGNKNETTVVVTTETMTAVGNQEITTIKTKRTTIVPAAHVAANEDNIRKMRTNTKHLQSMPEYKKGSLEENLETNERQDVRS